MEGGWWYVTEGDTHSPINLDFIKCNTEKHTAINATKNHGTQVE